MNILSVFVDESGDVGGNSEWHIVSLVFHDQSRPIDIGLARLGGRLRDLDFPLDAAIHTAPLIRRKEMFSDMAGDRRKKVFSALFNFCMAAGCPYAAFAYRKRELGARSGDEAKGLLQARLARDVKLFLDGRLAYFTGFDKVIVYYDNGQHAVAAAVREAFAAKLFEPEFRLVFPHEYRLLQVADLVCTLEHLRIKDASKDLTRSDLGFFGSAAKLRRNYLRDIAKLRME